MIRFVERTTIFIHGYLIQCFCDFAPLNSNSSARTGTVQCTHTHDGNRSNCYHDEDDDDNGDDSQDDDHNTSSSNNDGDGDEHQHTETHTLSTLLMRISLALSPASQFTLFGFDSLHAFHHGPCWILWLLASLFYFSPTTNTSITSFLYFFRCNYVLASHIERVAVLSCT